MTNTDLVLTVLRHKGGFHDLAVLARLTNLSVYNVNQVMQDLKGTGAVISRKVKRTGPGYTYVYALAETTP